MADISLPFTFRGVPVSMTPMGVAVNLDGMVMLNLLDELGGDVNLAVTYDARSVCTPISY
jgi:hypothetical protein